MTWLAGEMARALGEALDSDPLCTECSEPLPKGRRLTCDEDCYQQRRRRMNRERMQERRAELAEFRARKAQIREVSE